MRARGQDRGRGARPPLRGPSAASSAALLGRLACAPLRPLGGLWGGGGGCLGGCRPRRTAGAPAAALRCCEFRTSSDFHGGHEFELFKRVHMPRGLGSEAQQPHLDLGRLLGCQLIVTRAALPSRPRDFLGFLVPLRSKLNAGCCRTVINCTTAPRDCALSHCTTPPMHTLEAR